MASGHPRNTAPTLPGVRWGDHPFQESCLGQTEMEWQAGRQGEGLPWQPGWPNSAFRGLADGTARLSHQPGATN